MKAEKPMNIITEEESTLFQATVLTEKLYRFDLLQRKPQDKLDDKALRNLLRQLNQSLPTPEQLGTDISLDNLPVKSITQPAERKKYWALLAYKFLSLTEIIINLRKALDQAEIVERAYSPQLQAGILYHTFLHLPNRFSANFLLDILYARMKPLSPGGEERMMRYDRVVPEAELMARELGMQRGLKDPQMQGLDLYTVVRSVLAGKLKLTSQNASLKPAPAMWLSYIHNLYRMVLPKRG